MSAPLRTAAILAIGSELLGTHRLDTNSLLLAGVLERFGVELVVKSVVGDDETALDMEMGRRLEQVDLLITTGGLGPTADDRTRASAARALGRSVAIDETQVERIRGLFRSFGREMPEVNRRQGEVIEGAEILVNGRGTAPGQRLEHRRADGGSTMVFLLPGPPRELKGMIADHLEPFLAERQGEAASEGVERRVVKVASLAESDVEQRIAPVYERFGHDAIAVLASPGEIRVEALARGAVDGRRAILDAMAADLRRTIGSAVFTDREEVDLETATGEALVAAGLAVVTAESCTGGWLAQRLTRVAGSSAFFLGGAVTYSNELKSELLGVDPELIESRGAVSEEVARAMASGALERLGGDLAVGITGVAGPGGGTEEKPVGTVHMALAGPDRVDHWLLRFPGDRERVRRMTTQVALDQLRRRALEGLDASQ